MKPGSNEGFYSSELSKLTNVFCEIDLYNSSILISQQMAKPRLDTKHLPVKARIDLILCYKSVSITETNMPQRRVSKL